MSDPLSIAASIIAVLQATAVTIAYLKDVRDAPEDRMNFLVELGGLQAILRILRGRVAESKSGGTWLVGIQEVTVKGGPLDRFTSDLRRLESKLAPAEGLKEIGRRLVWKLSKVEITETLARIERIKTLVSFALANDHYLLSQAIKEEASEINSLSRDIKQETSQIRTAVDDIRADQTTKTRGEEYQKIIDWLTPLNFRMSQNDIFQKREEGTGLWLLETLEFQDWIRGKRGTLWCPGMPGAGKTVLMSIVVNYLQKLFQDGAVAVVCVYCNYREQAEQTAENLVASLLKQAFQDSGSTSDTIKELYKRQMEAGTRPTLQDYMLALKSECQSFSRVFIVVDALDESREDETRSRLIDSLKSLSERVNVLVTSREIPSIAREFQEATRLNIYAHDQDVRKYIEGRIARVSRRHLNTLRDQIVTKIAANAKGMFLLAQLHMDAVMSKHNVAAMRKALETLPKGMDESYDKAIERIDLQNEDDRALAKDVLSWITYACRPLSIKELQHAIAVTPEMKIMDLESLTDVETLISVCAGLVVVDEASNTIRLVHYTTQEYFERLRKQIFPGAQAKITTMCLTYLLFDVYGKEYEPGDELRLLRDNNPLLEYAALHWGDHALGEAEELCAKIALDFFRNRSSFACASQILQGRWDLFLYSGDTFSGLHMCAFFGLTRLIGYQLENGATPDTLDSHERTPLCWASRAGNEEVVRLLVSRNDVAVNSRGDNGRTALSWAAEGGHETVVNCLLAQDGIEVNSKDKDGRTPLIWAVRGRVEVVNRLLACEDVKIYYEGKHFPAILEYIIDSGKESLAKLFLERIEAKRRKLQVEELEPWAVQPINRTNKRGRTLLHHAAFNGWTEMVRLLLTWKEVKVASEDEHTLTPLFSAVHKGHDEVVRLLCTRDDVDVNATDMWGRTPLELASYLGHDAVVTVLSDAQQRASSATRI